MSAHVETMAYAASGGVPWHRFGNPVSNEMTTDEMLDASGLGWTTSKRPIYFPKRDPDTGLLTTSLRVVPEEFALIRDSDESVLDTVGNNYKPVQNKDVFDFFKRFVEAGDMRMETAGSLKGGRFIWALARVNADFNLGGVDQMRGYVLLSQPHQFGFSLTAALTPVRVVCWNTITAALGANLDGTGSSKQGASFRMVHSREFNEDVKGQAERALGLATSGMTAFGHTAEKLSGIEAKHEALSDYFRDVLQLDKPEDDTEAAKAEAEEAETKNMQRFRQAFISSPGADLSTAKGSWWGAFNAVTHSVDHSMSRNDDNRLFNAWYGRGAGLKRRALELAVKYADAA